MVGWWQERVTDGTVRNMLNPVCKIPTSKKHEKHRGDNSGEEPVGGVWVVVGRRTSELEESSGVVHRGREQEKHPLQRSRRHRCEGRQMKKSENI